MDTASACQPYNWLTASCAAKRELALARTHCKTADSTSPRCEAERARELAAARSGEINTASACQPYNWLTASCKPERNGEQVAARNEDTANACQSYNWLTASCATKRELALARTHCKTADSTTPRCEAERAREFAAARNAEINASIAAVNAERAHVLALSRTHCKTADSTTPRCEAERAREFAEVRNAEINASIAAVNAERARAFAAARNAEISASIAAVNAQRAPAFAAARNAEINASIAAVAAERARAFAAARNAEINASIAAVAAERARAFAATRNAEINASIAAVNALRGPAYTPLGDDVSTAAAMMEATQAAFVAARNAEIDASIAAVNGERARAFAAARNAEIEASIAAVNAQRAQAAFAAARNAEINASIAAVATQRALRAAEQRAGQTRVETGAISLPDIPVRPDSAPIVRRTRSAEPCREAGRIMSPLQFSDGRTDIEQVMKPELDRIAMMARTCPAIRIEIHGHSDNSATTKVNRYLAQRRADAAVTYLVQAGVGRDRLAAIGHAEAQPVAPNTSAQNRARNRRIEVMIKDPATDAAAQRVMWDLAELLDPTYVPPLARLSP
jgi:outer membrane protein OmpA-like peptidoglycan-associated protein